MWVSFSTIVTANFSFTMVLMSHFSYIFSPRGCTANFKCPKLCGRQSELLHIRIICRIPPLEIPKDLLESLKYAYIYEEKKKKLIPSLHKWRSK